MKNLVVIAAPSGTGKTTICRELQKQNPEIHFSVSCTTRPIRHYEKDGYDYHFISDQEFERLKENGELVEYEEVHGYYYGTKKEFLDEAIKNGEVILLDLDVKGGLSIKKLYPERTSLVFVEPPNEQILIDRLKNRGADSEERIKVRLQRFQMEMSYKEQFDHIVINDKLEVAVKSLKNIVISKTKGVIDGN
ncbi:MAG: guanylate kinase [Candidatus Marinimicrobia bacterium]|nr:guanylate kinase [Candidatus Neomarinimicrobiota bacterium]